MKCDDCFENAQAQKSKEPACCAWYLDHVAICGENVEKCPNYRKRKGKGRDSRARQSAIPA